MNVGGNGKNTNSGGYNGGGASGNSTHPNRSGGGATHIGTRSGVLSSLSSYKSTVLIVAGGAGGPADCVAKGEKGAGGGISGNGVSLTWDGTTHSLSGANQSGGYAFGQGQPGHSPGGGGCADGLSGGGGGGWYGGYASQYTGLAGSMAGSGGSGYIGNSSLISGGGITKHMTCYSCTTSTAVATRTNSNTNVSATATADYSKTGNGYARITWMGDTL